jgi:hypothetical protein
VRVHCFAVLTLTLISGALSVWAQSLLAEPQAVPFRGKIEAPHFNLPGPRRIPAAQNMPASTSQPSVCAIPLLKVTPSSPNDKMPAARPRANIDTAFVVYSMRVCGEPAAKAPQFSFTPHTPTQPQPAPRIFPNVPPLFPAPPKK